METPEKYPKFIPSLETHEVNIDSAEALIRKIEEKTQSGKPLDEADLNKINAMVKSLQEAQAVVPDPKIQTAIVKLITLKDNQ